MHAIELSLKAFAKQREMQGTTLGKPPPAKAQYPHANTVSHQT
jgi:hypothetical protein